MSLAEAENLIMSLPGDLPRQMINEFARGWHLREVLATIEQERIGAEQPERTWVNGLGEMTLSIAPDAFHYWGQRLGYKCWGDKKFRREFARDNPAARVRSRARKTMLRVNGFKAQGGQTVSREAHNLEIAGSTPAPATSAAEPRTLNAQRSTLNSQLPEAA